MWYAQTCGVMERCLAWPALLLCDVTLLICHNIMFTWCSQVNRVHCMLTMKLKVNKWLLIYPYLSFAEMYEETWSCSFEFLTVCSRSWESGGTQSSFTKWGRAFIHSQYGGFPPPWIALSILCKGKNERITCCYCSACYCYVVKFGQTSGFISTYIFIAPCSVQPAFDSPHPFLVYS